MSAFSSTRFLTAASSHVGASFLTGPHAARDGAPEGQFGGLPAHGHPAAMARRPPPGWRPPPPHPPPHPGMWPTGRLYGVPPPRPPPGSPPGPLGARPSPLQGGRPPPHLMQRPPGPHVGKSSRTASSPFFQTHFSLIQSESQAA